MFKKAFTIIALAAAMTLPILAGETENINKKVTIIQAQGQNQKPGPIESKLLEECIISLPSATTLEATIESKNQFLKGIGGDEKNSGWVKTYIATVEIPYLVKQKELVIVPVASIEGAPPKMETFIKRLPNRETFVSDCDNGDIIAGRSNRQSYFSTAEKAKADAIERAKVWINQNNHLLCRE